MSKPLDVILEQDANKIEKKLTNYLTIKRQPQAHVEFHLR
jgi:hypothetical protein